MWTPARIGLWGGSYGGYLTALGLARASNLFAAGVDIHGVHDWNVVIRNFDPATTRWPIPKSAKLAFESSPHGVGENLEVARAADPWRRRSQRAVQRNRVTMAAALRKQGRGV